MDSNRIAIKQLAEITISHNHTNPRGAKYCVTCGEPLTEQKLIESQTCSACRHPVLPEHVYCNFCGAALKDSNIAEHYIPGKLDADSFESIKKSIEAKKK
jgi:predicted nucleic acid-binding Zn ribbon protein